MNKDILKGNWNQVKGDLKQKWGELTDNDLAKVEGRIETLLGLLQEKYGYTKEKAKEEFDRFISESKRQTRK